MEDTYQIADAELAESDIIEYLIYAGVTAEEFEMPE